jgi:O-antigen/teichoic acid export membrane protein
MIGDYNFIFVSLALVCSSIGTRWILNEVQNNAKRDDIDGNTRSRNLFYVCLIFYCVLFVIWFIEGYMTIIGEGLTIAIVSVSSSVGLIAAWTFKRYYEYYITLEFPVNAESIEDLDEI